MAQEGRIRHVLEMGAFMVDGSLGDKYAVSLFPNEKCQCPSTGICYHILAAMISVGLPNKDDRRILNLSQVMERNSRKRVDKKEGMTKPRTNDYEVNAAPDSSKVLDLSTDIQLHKSVIEQDGSQNVSLADQSVTPVTPIKHSTPRQALNKHDKERKKLHVRFESVTNDLFSDLDTPLPDIKPTLWPSNLVG